MAYSIQALQERTLGTYKNSTGPFPSLWAGMPEIKISRKKPKNYHNGRLPFWYLKLSLVLNWP